MEQILINLVDNAIRYTEKGTVFVKVKSTNKDEVIIVVEDTGIGISQNELLHIFERFYRVEKSRSRQHGGMGLGLAIVKKLVELQGGTINVSSEVFHGTQFILYFPQHLRKVTE